MSSSRNGESSFPAADLDRLKAENLRIEASLQSCRINLESLVPVPSGSQTPEAAELEEQLIDLESVLKGHFDCEEGSVLAAFRKLDRPELVLSLEAVILEKEGIFKDLAELKQELGRLISHNLGLDYAYDPRVLVRKMDSLALRLRAHQVREAALFQEAEDFAKGDT